MEVISPIRPNCNCSVCSDTNTSSDQDEQRRLRFDSLVSLNCPAYIEHLFKVSGVIDEHL